MGDPHDFIPFHIFHEDVVENREGAVDTEKILGRTRGGVGKMRRKLKTLFIVWLGWGVEKGGDRRLVVLLIRKRRGMPRKEAGRSRLLSNSAGMREDQKTCQFQ